jgi:hypothetical protein
MTEPLKPEWTTTAHDKDISCQPQSRQPPKQPPEQNEEGHLSGGLCNLLIYMVFMAPEVGLEPTTLRLTAECSAIELLRIMRGRHASSRAAALQL